MKINHKKNSNESIFQISVGFRIVFPCLLAGGTFCIHSAVPIYKLKIYWRMFVVLNGKITSLISATPIRTIFCLNDLYELVKCMPLLRIWIKLSRFLIYRVMLHIIWKLLFVNFRFVTIKLCAKWIFHWITFHSYSPYLLNFFCYWIFPHFECSIESSNVSGETINWKQFFQKRLIRFVLLNF